MSQTTGEIIARLREQRNPNICIWLCKEELKKSEEKYRRIIVNWKDIRYVDENCAIDNNLSYFEWDTQSGIASRLFCGLRWVIARNEQTEFCVVTSREVAHNCLIMFKDAPHKEELPDIFIKIKCFNKYPQIFEYCRKNDAFKFSLDNNSNFIKASGIDSVQGATVYKDIKTNNFWYLDMLHKNHYEVFDPTGKKHLGEADMEGNVDKNKKDRNKKPIIS